jgi:tRNA A-37 threonylcarbamoyl transferase component Bud32
MSAPSIRLRNADPGLLALPWSRPLEEWPEDEIAFRRLPVGPSRHLVRFVETGGVLRALKELPIRTARREYEVLINLEAREFTSVRAAGLVERHDEDAAILVTDYLPHSLQFRRLFQRLPEGSRKHRERLLDAMASLLVDLHRHGVFWGDCSLANTLFRRDGQLLQAYLVDAETSEVHPSLSVGQRTFDLDILVENVAGDLADLGAVQGRDPGLIEEDIEAAESVRGRYDRLWDELHRTETIGLDERYRVEKRIRRLNELGFGVGELELRPIAGDRDVLRLSVVVTSRRFHARQLRALTGLEVGEGQATILLNDLRAFHLEIDRREPGVTSERDAAERWLREVAGPGMRAASAALTGQVDAVQAYCDFLEVRWLLSEDADFDVGDEVALVALAARGVPPDAAAVLAAAEGPHGDEPLANEPLANESDPADDEVAARVIAA